jgi:hypothetical protein
MSSISDAGSTAPPDADPTEGHAAAPSPGSPQRRGGSSERRSRRPCRATYSHGAVLVSDGANRAGVVGVDVDPPRRQRSPPSRRAALPLVFAWGDILNVGPSVTKPTFAGVIQLVECQLPKLDVAGSSPVARSFYKLLRCKSWRAPAHMHRGSRRWQSELVSIDASARNACIPIV